MCKSRGGMALRMHQGSCSQQACSTVRVQRAAWRGRSSTNKLPWGTPTRVCAGLCGGSLLQRGGVECRFVESPRFPREIRRRMICNYGGLLTELSRAANTLEWEPAVDNLLLVLSIALAYIAGIVTPSSPAPLRLSEKQPPSARLEISQEIQTVQKPAYEASFSGEEDLWNSARLKLSNSTDVGGDMEDDTVVQKTGHSLQLSLQGVARGPRLRLLLITLEELNKESAYGMSGGGSFIALVGNWQQNENFLRPDWSGLSMQRLCEVIVPICRLWMCREHTRNTKGQPSMTEDCVLPESLDKSLIGEWNLLFDSYSQNYGERKSMKSSLLATGKAEFYADFLYNLCSGCVRQNGYCGAETLRSHKNLVLEDLIIFVADKASALYLDLISTGSTICDSQWFNMMAQSIPSTRLLEKFRNEVALNGWLNDNFQSVTAMFEDRYDLWILKTVHKNSAKNKRHKSKLRVDDSREQESQESTIEIERYKLFARRARALRALTGWRYYFSLYLEFSDICGPLLRTVVTKLGEGISFLLVTLIGRSLGLIYRGIRQSIQWN
ncbi:hypothetical protein GOP47_0020995 [Adiantum capillus-veneris]|uniref:Uncharacterized protein n=1 Tax=Adiantum capillus-veneris TaxID=13818 RepID=A0A9D4UAH2_ADICA|nr:hypothetical protein GOP47_0020995 [Adiantum capillus-veneris]